MTLTRKLLTGGTYLAIGQVVGQLASLLRNIILARLLVPDDFGVATTFVLSLTMLEMISSMSVELLLVQSKNGDKPGFLDAVHGFMILRGAVVSAVLFFAAESIASVFKVPDLVWAYQMLLIVPILKAFTHMEYKRVQRIFEYKKEMWVETIPQVSTLVLLYPVYIFDSSPSIGLWLVIVQTVVVVAVSHLIAESKYRFDFDSEALREVLVFGVPLVFSGMLMFFAIQGDRFLVGYYFSSYEFGVFSAVALLVLNISNALAKFTTSLMLPPLAGKGIGFHQAFFRFYGSFFIGALIVGLVLVVMGDLIVQLLFGQDYIISGLTGAFALLFVARVIRFPITIASIAKGLTRIPLYANVSRFIGFGLALLVAVSGGSLVKVVLSGALGEFLANVTACLLFRNHYDKVWMVIISATFVLILVSLIYSMKVLV